MTNRIMTFAFVGVLTIILGAFSCGGGQDMSAKEKAIAVTVEVAALRDISVEKVYTGTLEGIRQASIFASIPEAVVDLPASEGSRVKSGQGIIYLDKSGAYSRYKQSRAVYKEAKDNFEKMQNLFDQGAISEQAYNGAKTGYDVARANYTAAKQQVELTSPIDGVLTDLSVNIGEFAPLGVPLATIAQTDKMRMTVYADAVGASNVKPGFKAAIDIDLLGGNSGGFTGVVTEVSRSADPVTRLFKIEIRIDNKAGLIRPGMFARARLTVSDLKSVLTIPREALFSVEGVHKIYRLAGDRAEEHTVTAGESTRELVQISSGLSAGDTVIVLGRNLIEDGSLVRISGETEGAVENSIESDSGSEG